MWTCPKCNQKFYNRNQSHSCGKFLIADFLSGKTDKAVGLFNSFLKQYRHIGEFELHPVKTRVALLTGLRFASINKLGRDYLDGHLVLTEEFHKPKIFYKVNNLNDRFFVHHFRIYHAWDISAEPSTNDEKSLCYWIA